MPEAFIERYVCKDCGNVCRASGDRMSWPRVCPACGRGSSAHRWYDQFAVAACRRSRAGLGGWEFARDVELNDKADLYAALRAERRFARVWIVRMGLVGGLAGMILGLGLAVLLGLDFS